MKIGTREFDFQSQIYIMGILNVTPDSFSDGGDFLEKEKAVSHGLKLIHEGADILDVGGESTRPGSEPVAPEVEIERVIPVIESIRLKTTIPISIDTTKAVVAKAAIDAGADMVNDVSAGNFDPEMVPLVAKENVPIVLMHMKGRPKTMQESVYYDNMWEEILGYLKNAIRNCESRGIDPGKIIVDPGIGFGKLLEHNIEIIRNLNRLKELSKPILVGPSRKSFIGQILDLPVSERLEGTLAAAAACINNGASIIRVHDVLQVRRFLKVYMRLH